MGTTVPLRPKKTDLREMAATILDQAHDDGGTVAQNRLALIDALVPLLWDRIRLSAVQPLLSNIGLCALCGEQIIHDLDEPFASCGCGTSEWTSKPPLLQRSESGPEVRRELWKLWEEPGKQLRTLFKG